MSTDTISDFLTIIRNGLMGRKGSVNVPSSNFKIAILKVLKNEGYIKDFSEQVDGAKRTLVVFLKYVNGESVIHEIRRVSSSGRRFYVPANLVKPVIGGLGISVLSTNSGVVTDQQARKIGMGGEIICSIW